MRPNRLDLYESTPLREPANLFWSPEVQRAAERSHPIGVEEPDIKSIRRKILREAEEAFLKEVMKRGSLEASGSGAGAAARNLHVSWWDSSTSASGERRWRAPLSSSAAATTESSYGGPVGGRSATTS